MLFSCGSPVPLWISLECDGLASLWNLWISLDCGGLVPLWILREQWLNDASVSDYRALLQSAGTRWWDLDTADRASSSKWQKTGLDRETNADAIAACVHVKATAEQERLTNAC